MTKRGEAAILILIVFVIVLVIAVGNADYDYEQSEWVCYVYIIRFCSGRGSGF